MRPLTDLTLRVGDNQPTTVYLKNSGLPWDPAVAEVTLWMGGELDPNAVARLFAASPKMLEALKEVAAESENPAFEDPRIRYVEVQIDRETLALVRAAIAAVEGEVAL